MSTLKNSPKGKFRYPTLTTPDTKFKEEGEYRVNLVLDADNKEAKALIASIDRMAAEKLSEVVAEAKTPAEKKKWGINNQPYQFLEDAETGDPTGEVSFKFAMKASGISKKTGKEWNRKPVLFDAKGKRIVDTDDLKIGGGTIGKVSYEMHPYAPNTKIGVGVSLKLEAVQIIDLKTWGEKSADEYGFGAEEGYDSREGDGSFRDETQSDDEGTEPQDDRRDYREADY